MPPTFADLQKQYPTSSKADLFNQMGGEWPKLIDNPSYANTCAIRLSLALAGAGLPIPQKYREAITGDGKSIILKVASMGTFLRETIGKSYWGMSKNPGQPIDDSTIPKKTGILVYHAAWSDATGHFDLWTGNGFVGAGSLESVKDGYDLELWHIP